MSESLQPLGFYAKHTQVEPVKGYPIFTDGDSYVPVAHVFSDAPDALTYTRLFAAAPELVTALKALQEQFVAWWPGCLECEHDGDEHCVVCRGELALEQARAALALAQWQDKAVQG